MESLYFESKWGRLLLALVPMLKQQQKRMRNDTFFKLSSAQRCHRLGILLGKGQVFTTLIKTL